MSGVVSPGTSAVAAASGGGVAPTAMAVGSSDRASGVGGGGELVGASGVALAMVVARGRGVADGWGEGVGGGVAGTGLDVGVSGTGLAVGVSGTGLGVGVSGTGLGVAVGTGTDTLAWATALFRARS